MKNILRRLFRTPSPASRRPRRRPRPGVERLEDRWTPANLDVSAAGVAQLIANPGELNDITLVLNPGTMRYEFTDNGAPITVSGAGAGAAAADVQGAGTNMVTAKASFLTSITIDTGDLADFVAIRSTGVPTSVTTSGTGADNDTVTIGGGTGGVQGITGPVNVTNVNALSSLTVDDGGNATGRVVTMSDTTVHGLAPADITYDPAAISDFTVNGGSGADTFTVTNTIFSTTTTLNAGAGNDTVTVQAGAAGSTLNVNGQGGNNHFRVTPSANATFNFDTASQLVYTAEGTLNPTGPNAGTITAAGVNPVTFTNVTTVFIGAGTLQFSAPTFAVVETGGTAVITVTRARGIAGAVSVTFSTGGGTAQPGIDFTPTTQTVSFADEDLGPKFIFVPILDDGLNEANETLGLTLSNPTGGATLGTPSTATLTIIELPEPPPSVQLLGTTLFVTGTPEADVIFFLNGGKGRVLVFANGQFRGLFVPKAIIAFGGGGNDFIFVDRKIKVSAFLDGGPGNDTLIGGGGFNFLQGGPGTNLLVRGPGRNVLIGGGPGSGVVIFGTSGPDFIQVARRATPVPTLLVNFNGQLFADPYLQGSTVTVFGLGGDDVLVADASLRGHWQVGLFGGPGNNLVINQAG
jgi:Calx-beta domain/RTX calcium-binding nonapeptide repeat (4 copies)